MIAAPGSGFVFLAMPKAASTTIERSFSKYGEVIMRGRPTFKHINYPGFHRHVRPLLRSRGYVRSSYEVVCLFREPIDWLASWWRYRSRPQLIDNDEGSSEKYTGGVNFDEFARAYMDRSESWARLGRPARFVRRPDGKIGVDRIYRLEDINDLTAWLQDQVEEKVKIKSANVSPPRAVDLEDTTRKLLVAHFAAEYEIYEDFTVGNRRSGNPKILI